MVQFKSLRSWLTLWFLVLALLPVVVSSIIIYFQRVEDIRTHRIETLTAIRDLKVMQVEAWLNERLVDGKIIVGSQEIANLTKILKENLHQGGLLQINGTRHKAIEEMRALLVRYLESFDGYNELFVVDSEEGKVLVSSDRSDEGKFKSDYTYFAETLKKREAVLSDIYFSQTLQRPSMVLSVPIVISKPEATIIAVLVARIDLKDTIYSLLNERTGMGETGETLIVNKDGFALNELRWHENAPLRLKITADPAVMAIQGNKGVIEVEDYRDEKVLAAYTYLPQFGWGFVSKQDSAEVFYSIQGMLYNLSILVGVFAGIIIVCAVYIAKRITAPLLEMKEIAIKQQEGDLSARIAIKREDELGYLAESFNDLAGSIEVQMNIQTGSSAIFKSLVVSESLVGFSQALLRKLLEITDSRLAVFYLYNSEEQTFEVLNSIGAGAGVLKTFNAKSLEGELGVALASKQIERITDIPADTRFTFNAVAGQIVPREIMTIPLLERGEVKGVVSLASLQKYSDESLKILQMCWMPLSSALVNILSTEQTQRLVAELAEKNNELQAKSEELQSQSEELLEQTEELRGASSELESRRAQVEEADRLKSEFLSNMSHELRTPLNSVLALSQLMISRGTGKKPVEEKNFLKVIERNGRQLLSLINDILDLAKIESGRMDIFPSVFNIRDTVDRAVATIRPLAEEKSISISLNIGSLPNIESDEEKVTQIFLNLLSNAVKFTNQGEITLNVNATSQVVTFEVRDTGIGMLPEDLSHIFDEFRQIDGTTTRKHEGTGLGLSICQKLASLLGGQILVESTFGQGSLFALKLPLQIKAVSPARASQDSSSGADPIAVPSGPSVRRTILIVDDDATARDYIQEALRAEGYLVSTAEGGEQALRLAREYPPDVLLLDLMMPDMDGFMVLDELRKDPVLSELAVVILTAKDLTAAERSSLETTAKKIITKDSLTNKDFMTRIVAALQQLEHDSAKGTRTGKPQILVVEDNETAALQVKIALEEAGYCVTLASGGAEGLESVKSSIPDGMVLDLMMPEVDGFEVLETIRSTPWTEQLPVLVLTAKELTAKERAQLKHNHVQQLIQKGSVNKMQLVAAVRSLLAPGAVKEVPAIVQPQLNPDQSSNRTVLVVEDNPDNMLTISSTLAEEDCRIIAAEDGEQGVMMAEKLRPALILMDMHLPVMSGMEATKQIKSNPALVGIPIIALTANAMKGDREKLLAIGCDDYLSKPFDPADLQEKVRKWLR